LICERLCIARIQGLKRRGINTVTRRLLLVAQLTIFRCDGINLVWYQDAHLGSSFTHSLKCGARPPVRDLRAAALKAGEFCDR